MHKIPRENSEPGNPHKEGISRRDLLIGAGIGVSLVCTVAGGTQFVNNLPDFAVETLITGAVANGRNPDYFADDAIHVITTGTGAPLPDPMHESVRRRRLLSVTSF